MPDPPFRDFRDLDRQEDDRRRDRHMVVAVELVQKAIDPMIAKKFRPHRQHHLRLGKMPLFGLDLFVRGARRASTLF